MLIRLLEAFVWKNLGESGLRHSQRIGRFTCIGPITSPTIISNTQMFIPSPTIHPSTQLFLEDPAVMTPMGTLGESRFRDRS
jgi:hypothetical protein